MRVRYRTNWMGPVSLKWYEDRGLDYKQDRYCCGRIDFWNPYDDSEYPEELNVPLMRAEDWARLSEWLDKFETDEVWEFCQIVWLYEKDGNNPKISWYQTPEWYPYDPHK